MKKKLIETSLGIWTKEDVAKDLDNLLKTLPSNARTLTRKSLASKPEEIDPSKRSEISVITTENPDLEGDVVIAKGVDRTYFNRNPIVCLSHDMTTQVGVCDWIKPKMNGLIARTIYASKPDWYDGAWLPDHVLACIQSGLYLGKSIGFLARNVREATPQEVSERPDWKGCRVIDDCVLLEYSVCVAGMNPDAVVTAVAKGLRAESLRALKIPVPKKEKTLAEKLLEVNWEKITIDIIDKLTGRV